MRTNSRMGAHALTLVVLTGAVSLSGRVEAQQTGLFPLAPIRRQRVPCDQEDPTYKIYKHQYFGYHPTCWRTFPAGWGCPSAEAPNLAESLRQTPAGNAPEAPGPLPPGEEDRGAPPPRRPVGPPELPRGERDPFATDGPAGGVPNANPLPRGNPAPRPTVPGTDEDPFRTMNPRGASVSPSRSRAPSRSAPASPDEDAPELSAPARQPAQGSAARSGSGDANGDDPAAESQGPLLGLADSDIVRSDASVADDAPAEAAPAGSTSSAATPAAAPATQPRPRRRIFGNLFSSLGSSWNRP